LLISFILAFIISIIIYLISEKLKNMLNNYKHRELENSELLANQTKMVALSEMMENIAHQWRQPLSVISTLSSGTKTQIEFEIIDKVDIEKIYLR
jgi:two-component system, NtrC family, sensor kinase